MPNGTWITCWKCNTEYFLPQSLYISAKANEDISFFCPHGHSAHFPEGLTDTEKMRQRAQRAEQTNARLREERDAAQRRESAQKGQVTKLKNRSRAGVCLCCNRTFTNLARHMKSKHPNTDNKPMLELVKDKKTA